MTIKAAIFDLDGTLLDTVDDLAIASNAVLRKHGFPEHDVEAYKFFVGDGLSVLMKRAAPPGTSEEVIARCCETFAEVYATCWHEKSRPYDGIIEMLHVLRERDVRCTILSNKPDYFTQICVTHFFPSDLFEIVLGQREGVAKKPDPVAVFEILEKLAVDKDSCIYVGDTSIDMRTGKSAGLYTIGVSWGFRPRTELVAYGADRIVDHPLEIFESLFPEK